MTSVPESQQGPKASEDAEDFDKFWATAQRREISLKNVMGVDVVLPPTLPLIFQAEQKRLKNAAPDDDKAIGRLVGLLFGQDAYQRWVAAGMDIEQFGVLLMWGVANCSGNYMTLSEARNAKEKAEAEEKARQADPSLNGGSPKKALKR